MKWSPTIQRSSNLEKAVRQATAEVSAALGGAADLGFLFVSQAYRADMIDAWRQISREVPAHVLIGCTAGGVIGNGNEVEQEPAVSYTAGILPGVQIVPFALQQEQLPDADAAPKTWRDLTKIPNDPKPNFVLLGDPFSLDVDALISGLDFAYPPSTKVGGLASGGSQPNENLLIMKEKIISRGAVGVALSGDVELGAIVAQGCRPIGRPLSITECDGNVLVSVDNRSPLAYLQELYESLNERDRDLLQTSLFLGVVMDAFTDEPKQGDFLIRNIVGLDQANGIMAIGAPLRPGQVVQFHLRDARTSKDDLQMMLRNAVAEKGGPDRWPVKDGETAAVMFSCVGRGARLYGEPDHDSSVLKSVMGDVPVGGFFCNGEIGPISGKTHLHGYTSAIGVFGPKPKSA